MTRKPATRRKFLRASSAAAAAGTLGFPFIGRSAGDELTTIRIASLAPQGSSWAKSFQRIGREVSELTNGAVKLRFYLGGSQGDETAMVRKVRSGQLDGCAVTTVGLGSINKQLLMMQLPLLFNDYKKLDKVRDAMTPRFDPLLEKEGFIRTGWGDVGFVYLFTNTPVSSPSDIKNIKPWQWDADPIAGKIMGAAGANGTPLGVPDVLPALSTGMIDAFTNSPYGAIALQWFTKCAYVTNLKLAVAIGASVISAKTLESLPEEVREIMRKVNEENSRKLIKRIRRDNKKAVDTLVEKGIKVIEPTDFVAWANLAVKVRNELTGSVFDKALLDEMLGHIKSA